MSTPDPHRRLVTCQYNPKPHEVDDECVNVTDVYDNTGEPRQPVKLGPYSEAPYGCPTCRTVLNSAWAGGCRDLWHSDNRPVRDGAVAVRPEAEPMHRLDLTDEERAELHAALEEEAREAADSTVSPEPDFSAAIEAVEADIARMREFAAIHAPMMGGREATPKEREISAMVNAGIIKTAKDLEGFLGPSINAELIVAPGAEEIQQHEPVWSDGWTAGYARGISEGRRQLIESRAAALAGEDPGPPQPYDPSQVWIDVQNASAAELRAEIERLDLRLRWLYRHYDDEQTTHMFALLRRTEAGEASDAH